MMRRVPSLQSFVANVEARKRAAGITPAMLADARNSGERRTPEKRALLGRIQERARSRGFEPLPANF
jgi:hypothetical protein